MDQLTLLNRWIYLNVLFVMLASVTAPAKASAQQLPVQTCIQNFSQQWTPATSGAQLAFATNTALDCVTHASELTSLAALSIMMRQMHVIVEHNPSLPRSAYYQSVPSASPTAYDTPHRLQFDFERLKKDSTALQFLSQLEKNVFPRILTLRDRESRTLIKTLETTIYHLIAYTDLPPAPGYEGNQKYFLGPLFEGYRGDEQFRHYQSLAPRVSPAGQLHPVSSAEFVQLRNIYDGFVKCESTRCLYRMEARLVQALLLFMGRADFAQRVLSTPIAGYTPDTLPRFVGCSSDASENAQILTVTGKGTYWQYGTPDYVRDGVNGILGRTMYIQGINPNVIKDQVYHGQNGIIRSITPAAVQDLIQLGGFGAHGDRALQVARSGRQTPSLAFDEALADQMFSGVSRVMVQYWLERKRGRTAAAESLISSPFFTETSFADGQTLRWWVQFAYRRNPDTPYQLFGLDYYFVLTGGRLSILDRMVANAMELPQAIP
jgi:hypothetical protein